MRTFVAAVAFSVVVAGCATIDAAPPHALVSPRPATAPSDFRVCWVEYGRKPSWGQLVTAGFSSHPTFDGTVSGLLLKHGRDRVLLDAGNSVRFEKEISEVPFFTRQLLENIPGAIPRVRTAPEALRAIGEDPDALTALLVSHVHTDHLGGVEDLRPDLPVWMSADETYFLQRETTTQTFHVVRAQADAIVGRVRPLAFANAAYETFDRSLDLFGDGSVVLVPLPGHTPGSIGTFLTVGEKRIFHVGDTAWAELQIERRIGKGVVAASTDVDHEGTNAMVARLAALHDADPALVILPAHDRGTYVRTFGAPGCIPR